MEDVLWYMPKYLSIKRVFLKKSTIHIVLLVFGVLAIVMTLLTYYGAYSGNFVITMEEEAIKKGIILSSDRDFTNPSPRLFADSVGDLGDTTYPSIDIREVVSTDGNYYDPFKSFLAYTFYIKNNGEATVDINFSYVIKDVYRGTEQAIRFLLIENDTILKLYQMPDTIKKEYSYGAAEKPEVYFFEDKVIFREVIYNFFPEQVKKFTVIIYLEGEDDDCNDDILGGSIRTAMVFNIIDPED